MVKPCVVCERTNGTHSRRCLIMNKCNNYPSKEQVEKAGAEQICRWNRFLPGPGSSSVGTPEFEEVLKKEAEIIDLIHTRMVKERLMTPEISKKIGWD